MNIIVSDVLDANKYQNFVVVKDLKEVRDYVDKRIDNIIIHKFNAKSFDSGIFISEFYKADIKNFIYICPPEDRDKVLVTVLEGVDSLFFDDDFYFDDEEELMSLIANKKEYAITATTMNDTGMEVIHDFLTGFARGEARINSPAYLQKVTRAVNDLSELVNKQETKIVAMGESALEVFDAANKIISALDKQRRDISAKLDEFEANTSLHSGGRNSFGNELTFFPPVKYMGTANMLVIRELSPCRFLTSFVLGYIHHLHFELNRRVKLVIAHQKGAGVSLKYSNFTNITQDSQAMTSLYEEEIVATNIPKKAVMDALFKTGEDTIIVLDRLYGKDTIVNGRCKTVYAISGSTDLNRYGVKIEDCITSVAKIKGSFASIQSIKSYPREVDSRKAAYTQAFAASYKKLDDYIGVERQ